MTQVNDDCAVWVGLEAPDGLLYSIQELADDPDLLKECQPLDRRDGAVVFSDSENEILAQGIFLYVGSEVLMTGGEVLAKGEAYHHMAYQDDSPLDLEPKGDTLVITDLLEDVSVTMPLAATLVAFKAEADALGAFVTEHGST